MKRFVLVCTMVFLLLLSSACGNSNKAVYPIVWDAIEGLPEDFPQLAEGVSFYRIYDGENTGFELKWETAGTKMAETVAGELQTWLDVDFTKTSDDGKIVWRGHSENKNDKQVYAELTYIENPIEQEFQLVLVVDILRLGGM